MSSLLFYIILFIVVFALQSFAIRISNKRLGKVIILGSFLLILLMMGFRYNVGVDYAGHLGIYNSFLGKDFADIWSGSGDVGMKLIIGTLAVNGLDAKIMFWIYGILTLYPIYKINKNDDFRNLPFSMLVFNLTILPACLNIMRQGAAMSFVLLAFDYARHNAKMKKIIIAIAMAVILHTSALMMLPFLIVYWLSRKYNKRFWIWSLVIAVLLSIASVTFLSGILDDMGLSEYNYQLVVTKNMVLYGGAVMYDLVIYAIILLLSLLGQKKERKNTESKDFLSLIIGGTIFEYVGSATKFFSRISYYFSIFQVLLIPELLQNIDKKRTRFIMEVVCVAVLIGLFVFRCYVQGYYGIFPYQTWLVLE